MAESKYKAPLGAFPAGVLSLVFRMAKAFTRKITHIPSRNIVDGVLDAAGEVVTGLSDKDPNDEAQMMAVANKAVSSGSFYEGTRQTLYVNIGKIPEGPVRNVLALGTGQAFVYAQLLTDKDPNNTEQARVTLAGWLKTEDGVKFMTSLLDIVLDPTTADMIAIILIEAILGVIDDDGLAAKLRALRDARNKAAEAKLAAL